MSILVMILFHFLVDVNVSSNMSVSIVLSVAFLIRNPPLW